MDSGPRILIAGDRACRLLRLPAAIRRLRAAAGRAQPPPFPREVASTDAPEHPRQDFQSVLDIIAHGPSRAAPSRGRGEREGERHAYHR